MGADQESTGHLKPDPIKILLTRRDALRSVGVLTMGGVLGPIRLIASPMRAESSSSNSPCLTRSNTTYPAPLKRFIDKLDPATDIFLTEVYVVELERQLTAWSEAMCHSVSDSALLSDLVDANITFSAWESAAATALRSEGPLTAERYSFGPTIRSDRRAFIKSWTHAMASFSHLQLAEFQIFGIGILNDYTIETNIDYDLLGTATDGRREERTGTWRIRWRRQGSDAWAAEEWISSPETRVHLRGPGFTEITARVLDAASPAAQQLSASIDHWRTVLDAAIGVDVYGNHGIAAGDIDGSGYDSLYVCQPSGLPNRLLRNRGDGTFEDITENSGTGLLDGTASALFIDFRNRGRQDLLVVRSGGPLLFENIGNGRFEPQPNAFHFARPAQGTFTSVAVSDYNRDGFLDVYFCVYSYYQALDQYQFPSPYYDAQNGPPNFLFRNRGDGTFEDVTVPSGMDVDNNRFSFAVEWCDYDDDGWPDLYVANDFGRKNLYRNNRDGTFSDVAAKAGVEDYGPGMSTCWMDFDGDGKQDLYVANMWLPEGIRITASEHFLTGVAEPVRALYRKHNAGNSMYRNRGDGTFSDATVTAGTARCGWSWSCAAWDFDHDGWPDLYVANGFVSGLNRADLQSFFWRQVAQRSAESTGATAEYELAWNAVNELVRSDYSWSGYQRNVFFSNHGTSDANGHEGRFLKSAGVLGLDLRDDSRAFALADFDGDGRLEFALKNRTGPQLRIMQNDLQDIGHSIAVRLIGHTSNRDAIGAVVTLESAGRKQVKQLSAGSGFASQHTKELVYGVGKATDSVTLTVRWPNGGATRYERVPIARRVTIEEGKTEFHAVPFTIRRAEKTVAGPLPEQAKQVSVSTWLVAPLFGPELKLKDAAGTEHQLSDLRGQRALLVFLQADCGDSDRQVEVLRHEAGQVKAGGLAVFAVEVISADGSKKHIGITGAGANSFPLLRATEGQIAAWDIQYRYLFDRRRDLEYPTTFLLDEDGAVVCVYQGFVAPSTCISDAVAIPSNFAARLRKATPYPGSYLGNEITRDSFTYAVAFAEYGLNDAAEAALRHSLRLDPNRSAAWFNLGTIYLGQKRYVEATRALQEAVRLNPQDSDAWNNLGMIAGEQNNYAAALVAFHNSALANPGHLVAVQNMMQIYQYQQRPAEAQSAMQELVDKAPGNADLHLGLAMSMLGQNNVAGGKAELETAIRLRPNFPDALNNLGTVMAQQEDISGALQVFERCRLAAPDFDRPVLNEALLYRRNGDLVQARELLQAFLNKHPENTDVRTLLTKLGAP